MTDHIEDLDREADDLEADVEDEQVDRAPAPGNTPGNTPTSAQPPLDSGAITGGKLADDH
jgi:hypothetical protein